jgi:hypothetical protein
MALHPEVSGFRVFAAYAVGTVIAIAAGVGLASLLRSLREAGRKSRFLVDLWRGWIASLLGFSVAVAIGGPYLLTGYTRGGHLITGPYTHTDGMVASVPMGLFIAWSNWKDPLPRHPRLRRRIGAAIREAQRRRRDA